MRAYHDTEWGVVSHDDRHMFEMLILEGAQAGLSWSTVLNKRANYVKAFAGFDIEKVAKFDSRKVESLLLDAGIIRNRLKVESAISNAKAFIEVQREVGSFDKYVWAFVDDKQIVHRIEPGEQLPASDELSDRVSKDMKKRGFRFVGTTIVYSYLQAIGLINDHVVGCPFGAY
jgi:DNA-3-methyladenine glycosylase I